MIPKRFFQAVVLCYALLSLITPLSHPVRAVEATALILSRPWEILLTLASGVQSPSGGEGTAGEFQGPEKLRDNWWKPVFTGSPVREGKIALGARVFGVPQRGCLRLKADVGQAPPILSDDPVVHGNVLVGFVDRVEKNGLVDLLLLGHRNSRIIVAETSEGIAGGNVFFTVGGGSTDGKIRVEYLSSRFGLTSGIKAFTSSRYNKADIPSGLYLGRLDASPNGDGEVGEHVGIVPPFEGRDLCRLAVLVPGDRAGALDRKPVPPLRIKCVPVVLRLPPGFILAHTFIRISSGFEAGISLDDLLVSEGYLVGKVTRVGLLSSRGELFMAPGDERTLLDLSGPAPRPVRVRVGKRSSTICSITVMSIDGKRPSGGMELSPDSLLHLSSGACSGGELYPLCRILKGGPTGEYLVRCGEIDAERGGCLVAAR